MCKTLREEAPPQQLAAPLGLRMACVAGLGAAGWAWWKSIVQFGPPMEPHPHWVPAVGVATYLAVCLGCLRLGEDSVKRCWKALGLDVKATLKETMIAYNMAQVLLNAWMVYAVVQPLCTGALPVIDYTVPLTMSTAAKWALWIHYCDKYLEFFDTAFMLLRGNFKQVSFLHVYHHATIAFAWHAACYLAWEGDSYFGVLLNSSIHVMMYSYYTLSLMGISCPWKRYLTKMQLVQFAAVILFTMLVVAVRSVNGTHEPWFYVACGIQIGEMGSLYALFSAFYAKAYEKPAVKTL